MNKTITYGELIDKLKDLGYSEQIVQSNGHRHRVLKHKDLERATIFLPFLRRDLPAQSMHLTAVRAVLKNHGVVEEGDLPEFLLF
jgi:hypothetical protein